MQIPVRLTFHNRGLRSFIEVDLCARCPRGDEKGCCGYYSPVFYPLDLYFLDRNAPYILQTIWQLPHLTVLDHSVTVNSFIDPDGGYRCQFHLREGGCRLKQEWRESVCRHFVCPGINWKGEARLKTWQNYFAQLEEFEIVLNKEIADQLSQKGLSLRRPEDRAKWLVELKKLVPQLLSPLPRFMSEMPEKEDFTIFCDMRYGSEWTL